jgi:predicted 2-oxoglutarate/Fe(II)-dependent dioxygenase YbiX
MIIELPNYVDEATVQKIRALASSYAEHGVYRYGTYRDGKTVSITDLARDHADLKEIDEILHGIFGELQGGVLVRRFKPHYSSGDSGYEYHTYAAGDICHPHSDGEVHDGLLRYASVVLHLNTIDSGGELVFPKQNKTVKTEAGKIVIFPPYGMFEHYTTPAAVTREVIVTWFVYNDVRVQAGVCN